MSRKTPVERIPVVDQVGKRHVVVRYVEVPDGQKAAGPPAGAPAVEYRLGGGRGVTRTGEASFQTVDGLLNLKVLDP